MEKQLLTEGWIEWAEASTSQDQTLHRYQRLDRAKLETLCAELADPARSMQRIERM